MIRNISQESPPSSMDGESAEWIARRLVEISIALSQTQNMEVLYAEPDKPEIGHIRYFGAAIDATINAEGLWLYKSTGWVQIA